MISRFLFHQMACCKRKVEQAFQNIRYLTEIYFHYMFRFRRVEEINDSSSGLI